MNWLVLVPVWAWLLWRLVRMLQMNVRWCNWDNEGRTCRARDAHEAPVRRIW